MHPKSLIFFISFNQCSNMLSLQLLLLPIPSFTLILCICNWNPVYIFKCAILKTTEIIYFSINFCRIVNAGRWWSYSGTGLYQIVLDLFNLFNLRFPFVAWTKIHRLSYLSFWLGMFDMCRGMHTKGRMKLITYGFLFYLILQRLTYLFEAGQRETKQISSQMLKIFAAALWKAGWRLFIVLVCSASSRSLK